jgi:hypothetical protein
MDFRLVESHMCRCMYVGIYVCGWVHVGEGTYVWVYVYMGLYSCGCTLDTYVCLYLGLGDVMCLIVHT